MKRQITFTLIFILAAFSFVTLTAEQAQSQHLHRRPGGMRGELEDLNPFGADESSNYAERYAYSISRVREAEALMRQRREAAESTSGSAGEAKVSAEKSIAPALDQQYSTMQLKALRDYAAMLDARITLVKNQIVFLRRQLSDDLATVVKYAAHTRPDGSNREYERSILNLKSQFETKVDNIVTQLSKDCLVFEEAHARKMAELATSKNSLKTQMNSQVGNSKVVSHGTNMYVRNYVNFGGVEEPQRMIVPAAQTVGSSELKQLKAIPGKLSSGTGGIKQK